MDNNLGTYGKGTLGYLYISILHGLDYTIISYSANSSKMISDYLIVNRVNY